MKTLRVVMWTFVVLFLVVFVLPAIIPLSFDVIGALFLGWFGFLKRVVPQMAISWSGIGMVVLCSALIIGGTHWLCGWIYRHNKTEADEEQKWRWQWSVSLYVGVWILFLAAMGITGFVHQIAWMVASKEPLMVERRYKGLMAVQLRNAAQALNGVANDAGWDLEATREAFFAEDLPFFRMGIPVIEQLHVIFLPGSNQKLAAAVLFHRDSVHQQAGGFVVVSRGGGDSGERHEMKELPEVLARLQSH